jgi:hypothetical protein
MLPARTARTVLRLRAAECDLVIATPPGISGRAFSVSLADSMSWRAGLPS